MKTYRERIESLPAWKSGFPVSRAEALRVADAADALQAECDALRAVLTEAREWVEEYSTQMSSYEVGRDALKSLCRIDAAIDNERSKA